MSHPTYGLTMIVMVELLFERFGSRVLEVTDAVFVTLLPPGALTFTTIVIVAVSEGAIRPSSQRTVPVPPTIGVGWQKPRLVVGTRASVVFGGSGSLTSTVLAGSGPLLMTLIV